MWVSFVTSGFVPFAHHVALTLRQLGVADSFPLVVACADEGTQASVRLAWPHTCVFPARAALPQPAALAEYASVEFKHVVFTKRDLNLAALRCAAACGVGAVGMLDLDVAILRDPTPHAAAALRADPVAACFAQCDEMTATCSDVNACPAPCAGVMLFRTRDAALFDEVLAFDDGDVARFGGEQEFVRTRLEEHSVRCAALDPSKFVSGFSARVHEGPCDAILDTAALIHFNFLRGAQKVDAMRSWGVWRE